jgi:hypothetical protein
MGSHEIGRTASITSWYCKLARGFLMLAIVMTGYTDIFRFHCRNSH